MSLFPQSREVHVKTADAEIFARIVGDGPPLLLLHGFPQTHVMWHKVAPDLARQFTCVIPDLRGYGRSSCPANSADNFPYSKRAMAQDMQALMAHLGYGPFAVVGHDRGARVAYRLALDAPETVTRLAVLDIVPTYDMWHGFSVKLAMKAYHWLFLAQPAPLPEMLIEKSPEAYLDYTIASWTRDKTLAAFDTLALDDYRVSFARAPYVHASCNDYRAGATYDLAADEDDRAKGRKIACSTLAVWGSAGFPGATTDPLATWQAWCTDVRGTAIDSGHFIPEENPSQLLALLLPFLTAR